MRKDDWITKLYYTQLNAQQRNNRDSRKTIPSEKEIPRKQNKFEDRKRSDNT